MIVYLTVSDEVQSIDHVFPATHAAEVDQLLALAFTWLYGPMRAGGALSEAHELAR